MKWIFIAILSSLAPATMILNAQESQQKCSVEIEAENQDCNVIVEEEGIHEVWFELDPWCDPEKRWYFELQPGYLLFTDSDMRKFFDGGFTMRAQTGYRFYGPFTVWIDAGYFQKDGKSIGRENNIEIKLATLTLGLKAVYYLNSCVAVYGGAGPRLFMLMIHNDSSSVPGDDNEIGIGGGFDAGIWFFPVPQWPNFFLDAFGDYSWKKMHITPDEMGSTDNDVDVSSASFGIGLGLRF